MTFFSLAMVASALIGLAGVGISVVPGLIGVGIELKQGTEGLKKLQD